MKRYLITEDAQEDIADIRKYLAREAGQRAMRSTLRKIVDAFGLISRSPGAGHLREDLTSRDVKFWSVFSYVIVYDATKRPIEIVRVLHGNRDLSSLLGRDDE